MCVRACACACARVCECVCVRERESDSKGWWNVEGQSEIEKKRGNK